MPTYMKLCCSSIPQRFVICALCTWAMAIMWIKRRCVSGTLTQIHFLEKELIKGDCPFKYERCMYERDPSVQVTQFYWSFGLVQAINQAFNISYIISQIPVGMLADWYGARNLFGCGMMISSFMCFLFPFLIRQGPYWFMGGFIIQGFGQSVLFPCTISIVAQWAPISERSTFTGIILSGMYLGCACGHILNEIVFSQLSIWEIRLYTGGAVGTVWCLAWFCFARNKPVDNPFMSDAEYRLIQSFNDMFTPQAVQRLPVVPWKKIFKSLPFLSLLLIYSNLEFANYQILDEALTPYFMHVLHFSRRLSTIAAVIETSAIPTSVAGGILSDWLVNNKVTSKTVSRKIFYTIGAVGSVIFMMFIPLTGCNQYGFVVLLVTVFYLKGLTESVMHVSPIDLSPQNAGLLMGFLNTIAKFISIFAYEIRLFIISEPSDVNQWKISFGISLITTLIVSTFYLFYGSADRQPWSPASITETR